MNTKEKIILASLELFNEKGERHVTTNHIAAHLGMSPGNLYYHFRNKADIIYAIFRQYQILVNHYLQLPEERSLTVEDQFVYLEAVFEGLWRFRFLHRDLEFYLESDPRLQKDYQIFTEACLDSIHGIVKKLEESSILRPMPESLRKSFALNVWLVVTSWVSYIKAMADRDFHLISKKTLKQGVYQVICLETPYLRPEVLDRVASLKNDYIAAG